jgi:hypothetical protein
MGRNLFKPNAVEGGDWRARTAHHQQRQRKASNLRYFALKANGVTVDTCVLVEIPPGRTRQKVRRNIGNDSRRVSVDPLASCRGIQDTDMFPPPAINMGG